jgi:uncharacterized protein YdeI (BOF family)
MKKTIIALAAFGALSTAAFAEDGSNGASKYDSDTIANGNVVVEPANSNPETLFPAKKLTDDEQRRLDEKNGSRG